MSVSDKIKTGGLQSLMSTRDTLKTRGIKILNKEMGEIWWAKANKIKHGSRDYCQVSQAKSIKDMPKSVTLYK